MIAYTFWPLSDEDLADIFAHLRLQPPAPAISRELELTLRGRFALATGLWKVSAEQVDRQRPRWGELPRTTSFERGRYFASVTCSECHGVEFRGDALERAPSLALIAAYSPEAFRHFLRTGEALGGRELETMSAVAREAFSLFTDQEIADIYAFLRAYHGANGADSGAAAVGQEAAAAGAVSR
jgi:cytochrome c553